MKRYTLVMIIIIVIALILGVGFFVIKGMVPQATGGKVDSAKVVSKVYEKRNLWEEFTNDFSGIYETGFCFIDIDLDGVKELAVQLGGNETRNCVTKFYSVKEKELKPCDFFEGNYSLSVLSLKKYHDEESKQFYINQNTLKIGTNDYVTNYDKIDSGAKVTSLFSFLERHSQNGNLVRTFFVKGKEISEEEYRQEFEAFMAGVTEEDIYTSFIPFNNWKKMSEEEQKMAIEKSYQVDKGSYEKTITEQFITPIDLEKYAPMSINLTEAVYGNSFYALKEAFEEEMAAQVYTDKESFIYIIPFSDMLDNMIYYYQNGRIVAYVREFNGIGGSVTYYFNNGNLVSIDKTDIDPAMEFTPENATSIIIRSESAWNMYGA